MNRRKDTLVAIGIMMVILVIAALRHVINSVSILAILAIVPSVILHEVSHGYVAYLFGDDTAKRSGRLSLNPFVHIDVIGTLILPALLLLVGLTPFGYAKPVPVDVSKLKNPRNQGLLVALVGPFVNIVIAIVAGLLIHASIASQMASDPLISQSQIGSSLWDQFLFDLGTINVLLAVFNLIPIPPLDGSAILERFLPEALWQQYLSIRRFALPVLLFVVLLSPTLIYKIVSPVTQLWLNHFIP
jgi:Zn-dependent protease